MDQLTLLSCLLVNRKWEQIISKTPAIIKQLPLLLTGIDCVESVPKLTRKYQKVTFFTNFYWSKKLEASLFDIGKGVTELHLQDCVFYASDFPNVIKTFPYLEKLTISDCLYGHLDEPDPVVVTMKNLKMCTVIGYPWMLQHINCQLNEFNVLHVTQEDQHLLLNFLNTQMNLKGLVLSQVSHLFCSRAQDEKVDFKMKFQLRYLQLSNLFSVDEKNLMKFLRVTSLNCEVVKLNENVTPNALKFVLRNLHNIKLLEINARLLPKYFFYFDLKPNKSLKDLKIVGSLDSTESLLGLLSNFPGLLMLNLIKLQGLCSKDMLLWSKMSSLTKGIIKLSVQSIGNMTTVKFPFLAELDVDTFDCASKASLVQLNENCPNIQAITIHASNQVFSSTKLFRSLRKLRTLKYSFANANLKFS